MSDDPLETTWRALLEQHWDDDDKHKAFVALASALSRLPDAAALYREVADDPARRDRAEKGKQLVVQYAMLMIETLPRSTSQDTRGRARWLYPLVLLGTMIVADFFLAALMHQRAFVSPQAFVLEILVVLLLPWRRLLP